MFPSRSRIAGRTCTRDGTTSNIKEEAADLGGFSRTLVFDGYGYLAGRSLSIRKCNLAKIDFPTDYRVILPIVFDRLSLRVELSIDVRVLCRSLYFANNSLSHLDALRLIWLPIILNGFDGGVDVPPPPVVRSIFFRCAFIFEAETPALIALPELRFHGL
jgi:hypothetical protein